LGGGGGAPLLKKNFFFFYFLNFFFFFKLFPHINFTKFFQAYYLPTKFGYDKRKAHLSSLIVSGTISRDEALEEMKKPLYGYENFIKDKLFILEKLSLSKNEFEKIMSLPNKHYTDYPNNEILFKKVKLLHLAENQVKEIAKMT